MDDKTILVINHTNSLLNIIQEELIKNIETIYLYDNNHTEKLKLGKIKSDSISNKNKNKKILREKYHFGLNI